jgi:hypothetical protein
VPLDMDYAWIIYSEKFSWILILSLRLGNVKDQQYLQYVFF